MKWFYLVKGANGQYVGAKFTRSRGKYATLWYDNQHKTMLASATLDALNESLLREFTERGIVVKNEGDQYLRRIIRVDGNCTEKGVWVREDAIISFAKKYPEGRGLKQR